MRRRRLEVILFAWISASAVAQDESIPEEFSTLIQAYTVGKLSIDELRDTCKWQQENDGVDEELVVVRKQNIQFCEGFLAGSLEFSQIESKVLASLKDSNSNEDLSHCQPSTVDTLKKQILTDQVLHGQGQANASKAMFSLLLACKKR